MELHVIQRMPPSKRKKVHRYLRMALQLLFFLLYPSAFTAAFGGVKYIFIQLGISEEIALTPFVAILLGLCIYTMLFGRFFCGFACAFGSLGDALHGIYRGIGKKWKRKIPRSAERIPERISWIKYLVLAAIVLMCFAGVYDRVRGTSPWDVFSMVRAGNLKLTGFLPGVTALLLLMAGMCVWERFFCRVFCPMGAVFSLLPVLPIFSLHRDRDNCVGRCAACTGRCPSSLELPEEASLETPGDCFQCQKCIDICPRGNIHCGLKRLNGNELWFTLLRALLLAAMMWRLGV